MERHMIRLTLVAPQLPRIVLSHPPTSYDDESVLALYHDPMFLQHLPLCVKSPPITTIDQIVQKRTKETSDSLIFDFRIHNFQTGAFLGTAKLRLTTGLFETCEAGIGVIGNSWKQGIATEALYLLLEYAFRGVRDGGLGCNRVSFTTSEENTGMKGWLEARANIRKEGSLKKAWKMRTGDLVDVALYGLQRSEWEGNVKQRLEGYLFRAVENMQE
ncbi:hypothetical protein BDR26DRAFT_19266 [Obelidium mucronatum]|nr:hypothetical protein BDR26DRAFT_19266 [Obelidium mucronatum]